ncbi:ABC transporter permease [Herbiconiux flava]|uniref:Ribose transport system permease protein n=1 Tax=Herbiconiux flava TaxID=881268 RepID=A0A852SLQ2_9MICO|nr:ABC transporter permease [Herbiconiux flava]NYD69229.1 ribose transport system permease protein [Herbiconiux flava]GLK15977.1 ABC transporter permease [Herbiconiux flava]
MSATERRQPALTSSRWSISRGLVTVGIAVIALLVVSALFAPSSVSQGAVLGMLPFAAVLSCVGLGQMLVVQQGGIDLSIPGAVSLSIVVVSRIPNGDDSLLVPAVLLAIGLAVLAGLLNGLLIGRLGLNAIIATLGTNALLFAVVLGISGGSPTTTTRLLRDVAGGLSFGIPNSVFFALAAFLLVTVLVKKTVAGRRFEAVGANPVAARATGLRVRTHQAAAYVWAQLLYCLAGILLAGITAQPTAFQGNAYLIPAVAVVVLGGTSLLGGRGFPLATVVAAVFLSQLDQFVLAAGVPFAVRSIIQAAALAVGVALYTIDWAGLRARLGSRQRVGAAA